MGGANGVFPPTGPSSGQLEAALDNLALAASTDSAILQQLTAANLELTKANAVLTATNKTLVESATKARAAANAGGTGATAVGTAKRKPLKNGYCWTHGQKMYGNHSDATCTKPATGHRKEATYNNTMGGSELNKGWDSAST